MPARKKNQTLINLLPQEEFASSTFGRILAWLLTTFRTIVIISEMIVMAAFLSRFWLDARNNDLADSIKQRQAVVASYSNFEKDFRSAQKKLSIFSVTDTISTKPEQIINTSGSIIPANMRLSSVTFSGKDVEFKGTSNEEQAIAIYTVSLKSTNLFSDVAVNQLALDTTGTAFDFSIKATLKGRQNGN